MSKSIIKFLTLATFISLLGLEGAWSVNKQCVQKCTQEFNDYATCVC
jgi:hypothetical protein